MKNVILKKENGVSTKFVRETLTSKEPYLNEKEKCFRKVLDNTVDFDISTVKTINKTITTMLHTISKTIAGSRIVEELYNRLRIAKNKKDLESILTFLQLGYEESLKNKYIALRNKDVRKLTKFDKYLINNEDLVISIATKKIVSTYFLNTILSLDADAINKLENDKVSGVPTVDLLKSIGINFTNVEKNNGIENLSKKIFSDTIDIAINQIQRHLCWEDCVNASPFKCKKITDKIKKDIDEYAFITDGYMIYNDNGEVEHYLVTKCENYEREYEKHLTLEEKERIRNIKNGWKLDYFNSDTIDEADRTQKMLFRTGQLKKFKA